LHKTEVELKRVNDELVEAQRIRDVAIKAEYDIRTQKDHSLEEIKKLQLENGSLRKTLDGLANLFNDIFVSFKDTAALFGTIDRNTKNVLSMIEAKTAAFNGTTQEEVKK
jgi:regulator of replication initiation timing